MDFKNIKKDLAEKIYQTYFCDYLIEKNDFISRTSKQVDKNSHVDIDLLCEFLQNTQETMYAEFVQVFGDTSKKKLLDTIYLQLQNKEFIDVFNNDLIVENRFTFELRFFPNNTNSNKVHNEKVKANIFSVVKEYKFDINSEQAIDIVLFLNGFPITTIETKYTPKGQTYENAVDQYLNRDLTNMIFKIPFLHIACDENTSYVASKFYSGKSGDFMPFNKDIENPVVEGESYNTNYLYNDIFTKESILDLLSNFIFIDKKSKSEDKLIFPRFHQRRVVKKIQNDILESYNKNKILDLKYLVEHSAGSGKSKSITWLSEKLMNLFDKNEKRIFDTVVVVTDRIDLDTQLKEDFKNKIGIEATIKYANNSKDLLSALNEDNVKLVVSILHGFSYLNKEELKNQKDKRICFIIDEAHRSQNGNLNSNMNDFFDKMGDNSDFRTKYPNSVFIAFTATPSDKTLKKFGLMDEKNKRTGSFDVYSMGQAIKEGYIKDSSKNIIPYITLYKLNGNDDEEFYKEYSALTLQKKIKKIVFEDIAIIKHKISMILHYFDTQIKSQIDGKAKCMIIASSRKAAIAYKILLDEKLEKYNLECGTVFKSLIAFSGKESNKELNIIDSTENTLNGKLTGKNIPEQFKLPEYKFLIVADKYQTGFDEPLLFGLFLDKSLSSPISVVQTLSRTNRTYFNKVDPITVDFSNSYENLVNGFNKYLNRQSGNTIDNLDDFNDLYTNILSKNIVGSTDLIEFEKTLDYNKIAIQDLYQNLANRIRDIYNKKDNQTKLEFRQNLGKYVKSFEFLNSFCNLSDKNHILLGLFGKVFLFSISEQIGSISDLKKALEKITVEKPKIIAIKGANLLDKDKKSNKSQEVREVQKLTIAEIMEILNDTFDRLGLTDKEHKKLMHSYLTSVVSDEELKQKITNAPKSELENLEKSIKKTLDDRISEYLFNDSKGFEIMSKLSNKAEILTKVNNYAFEILKQERYEG
jgi:type I restriction enzyme R subunit